MPKTADAFKRVHARGEMYCSKCYEEREQEKHKFKVFAKNKGREK